MNILSMWLFGIIALIFSIWMGLQIEVRRDWIAGIFLYVVPAVTLTSLTILTIRHQQDQKVKKEEIKVIREGIDFLKRDTSKIDLLLESVNSIQKEIDTLKKLIIEK